MEALLILQREAPAEVRKRIESHAHVVQEGSDKVVVVEGPAEAVEATKRLPGVSTPETLTMEEAAKLSTSERLFIDGWKQRAQQEAKDRPGEGVSWGDKRFQAPR